MKLVFTQAQLLAHFQSQMPSIKIEELVVEGVAMNGANQAFNPDILPISIGRYLKDGNLIWAIKEARALYGIGLKEAKEYCERYYRPSYGA